MMDTFLRYYTVRRAAGTTPQTRIGTTQKYSGVGYGAHHPL